ncbi:MAG: hypothetical protein R3E12_02950 [Candidatus Eisenbacteria bacterium]
MRSSARAACRRRTRVVAVVGLLVLSAMAHSEDSAEGSGGPASSSRNVDPMLFRADFTTELEPGEIDAHNPPHVVFVDVPVPHFLHCSETHDCGGFHGDQMFAASILDCAIPVELQNWASPKSPLP